MKRFFSWLALAAALSASLLLGTAWAVYVSFPSTEEIHKRVVLAPRSPRIIDRDGRVELPRSRHPAAAHPPAWFLDDLVESEGYGPWSLAAGINRQLKSDTLGSAPLEIQSVRLLDGGGPVRWPKWKLVTDVIGGAKARLALGDSLLLDHYVNSAPFFRSETPGIERAARSLFGVGAEDLSRVQGLQLLACLPSPCGTRPDSVRQAAYRNIVAEAVEEGRINRTEVVDIPDTLTFSPPSTGDDGLALSKGVVLREAARLVAPRGWDVETSGLDIHVTLDFELTEVANRALDEALARNPRATHAFFLLADPESRVLVHAVRAPRDTSRSGAPLDVIGSPSSSPMPASRFKVFGYALAADETLEYIDPEDVLDSNLPNVYVWDDGRETRGCGEVDAATFRDAIAQSCNGTALYLVNNLITPVEFADHLALYGIEVDPTPDVVLGSQGVSERALAEAYHSLFANDGVPARFRYVDSLVTRDGQLLYDADRHFSLGVQAVKSEAARLTRNALQGSVEPGGTAEKILEAAPGLTEFTFALKTGTSPADSRERNFAVTGVFRPSSREGWYTVTLGVLGPLGAGGSAGTVAVPELGRTLDALKSAGAFE